MKLFLSRIKYSISPPLIFLAVVLVPNHCHAEAYSIHNYPQDGYSIEVPLSWKEQLINSPTGGVMRAFVDSDKKLGAGYCQVEIGNIDKNKTPKLASSSSKQLRTYFSHRLELDEWLTIYPNLASAENFKFLNSFPSKVGGQIPAAAMEFRYSIPHGYFYRTRAHVAVSNQKMYSLWCVTIGNDEQDADNNFRSYLINFQAVVARFKPSIKQ